MSNDRFPTLIWLQSANNAEQIKVATWKSG